MTLFFEKVYRYRADVLTSSLRVTTLFFLKTST